MSKIEAKYSLWTIVRISSGTFNSVGTSDGLRSLTQAGLHW